MVFQTEYEFTLPRGYVAEDGSLCRSGTMRLATAADEILPLRDPRAKESPEYLIVLILARVITGLGPLTRVDTDVVERLFVQDLSYLQDFYNRINQQEDPRYSCTCPSCGKEVSVPVNFQQAGS